MKNQPKFIGFYDYTVILTYISALSGFLGISLAFNKEYYYACLCLLLSGLLDGLDGSIAATKKDRNDQEKAFGVQIDSLSDLVAFGLLPAAIVFNLGTSDNFSTVVCLFYLLAALIRLAYFTVEEQFMAEKRQHYSGLPVTSSALLIPFVYTLMSFNSQLSVQVITIVLLVMGILFISPFKLAKPQFKHKLQLALIGISVTGLLIFSQIGVL